MQRTVKSLDQAILSEFADTFKNWVSDLNKQVEASMSIKEKDPFRDPKLYSMELWQKMSEQENLTLGTVYACLRCAIQHRPLKYRNKVEGKFLEMVSKLG